MYYDDANKFLNFPNKEIEEKFSDAIEKFGYSDEITFHNLVRHLRNSISHKRLNVYPQISRISEISGFRFKDSGTDQKTKQFCKMEIVLTVYQIKLILFQMLSYIKD